MRSFHGQVGLVRHETINIPGYDQNGALVPVLQAEVDQRLGVLAKKSSRTVAEIRNNRLPVWCSKGWVVDQMSENKPASVPIPAPTPNVDPPAPAPTPAPAPRPQPKPETKKKPKKESCRRSGRG
ncbi:MAG: hypothetical protein ACKV19_27555 [Verrucomicrobiales bacterium]